MAKRSHNELIVREGWPFLLPMVALLAAAYLLAMPWWVMVPIALMTLFVLQFFRNPYRQVPADPRAIVSPGDGRVVAVRTEGDTTVISIFLNVFNVHVNRAPIGGTVESIEYRKGKFLPADRPEASVENESNALIIRDGDLHVRVCQVAGLIARRIVCWVRPQASLQRGERFGLIRFGSRVDLSLPSSCSVLVRVGVKVRGGSSVLAMRPEQP
jgi:phosphatidylserine decarboxylase